MVAHQELVETVAELAGLDDAEQARAATAGVVSAVAHCLSPESRAWLADQLPGTIEDSARVPGQDELGRGTEVVTEVATRLDTTPERGRYLAQAVLGALDRRDARLAEELRDRLPDDVLALLAPAGEPPHRAESTRPDVPTELSDDDVDRALRTLTGWTGDHTRISRTVQLPSERLTPLVNRVQREARTMNDHAEVERKPGQVTFRLRTGRAGVVTEPDVSLARRIDQAVADIGSGGRPG